MPTPTTSTQRVRDVLDVDPGELRDTVRVTLDRELLDELDRRRASVSRSAYVEMVLAAAMTREHPHLADDWTPERAADQRYARLQRYIENGR
jgi:post-segregation antitoxin (ccd killing protein)